MEYTIVNLDEKVIVGLSAVTGNNDPKMGAIIGGLWEQFFAQGLFERIENQAAATTIGLYSDYAGDKYTVTVGMAVSKAQKGELAVKTIPAGKYAKFSVRGQHETVVAKAWEEIWQMDLDRSYTADFEEYLNADMENAEVDIYIALK